MTLLIDKEARWVRASHTVMLTRYPRYSRPYHLEMPLLTEDLTALMAYAHRKELAFCIPIALPGALPYTRSRFEGFCKGALFLVRQMFHFWDVSKKGVPVFLGVSSNGMSTFREYAQLCNFPDANIVELPSYADQWAGWLIKMDMLDAVVSMGFQKAVHFDASLWLNTTTPISPCRVLLNDWSTQGFAVAWNVLRLGKKPEALPWAMHQKYAKDDSGLYLGISRVLGTTPKKEYAYWSREDIEFLTGQVFGVTAQAWIQAQSLVNRLRTITVHDEVVLAVLARELPMNEENTLLGLYRILGRLRHMASFPNKSLNEESYMGEWRDALGYSHEMAMPASAYPSIVYD